MLRRALEAGSVAAVVGGFPSTLHAIVTGRDPLEATFAAGSILLPHETRRGRLLAGAVPVHLALSLGWACVLAGAGARTPARGAAAGLAIAALDLTIGYAFFPRIRALPVAPQVADHLAYGATVGTWLARRT